MKYVVIRAWKTDRMKAHAHFTYHVTCWDEKEQGMGKENWITDKAVPSAQLSTEETPLINGFVRLVPLEDIALNATCCDCGKTLHNADEIREAIPAFKSEGWVQYELGRLQEKLEEHHA